MVAFTMVECVFVTTPVQRGREARQVPHDVVLPPFGDNGWMNRLGQLIERFWSDASGGRTVVRVTAHPDVVALHISEEERIDDKKMSATDLVERVRRALAVDITTHLVVIRNDRGAPWAGRTETDPTVRGSRIDPGTICHEMGHFFGAGHASAMPQFGIQQYADPTCVMGAFGFAYTDERLRNGQPLDGVESAGPGMSPSTMDVVGEIGQGGQRAPWLDYNSPAVYDTTGRLGTDVILSPWIGAPPPNYQSDSRLLILLQDATHEHGRLYITLRERARWDQGFPDALSIVVQELLPNKVSILLARDGALSPGRKIRVGRAPIAVEVLAVEGNSARVRVVEEAWRLPVILSGHNFPPGARIAGAAYPGDGYERMDLFVIAADGMVWNRRYTGGMWHVWELVPDAAFELRAGMAASARSGMVDLYVVGKDARIRSRRRSGEAWSGWGLVPGDPRMILSPVSSIASTTVDDDETLLAAVDHAGAVWVAIFSRPDRVDWSPLPADVPMSSVAAVKDMDGMLYIHGVLAGEGDGRIWTYNLGDPNPGWEIRQARGADMFSPDAGIAAVGVAPHQVVLAAADPLIIAERTTSGWPDENHWQHESVSMMARDAGIAAVTRDGAGVDVFYIGSDGTVRVVSRSVSKDYHPVNRQLVRTTRVSFRVASGEFMSADGDGGGLSAQRREVLDPQRFYLDDLETLTGDGGTPIRLFAVRTLDGRFVSANSQADRGLGLWANRDQMWQWEQFVRSEVKDEQGNDKPDTFAFKAYNGMYWKAESGGGDVVTCASRAIGPWEEFRVESA